jgi:hypothetical protein
VRKMTAAWLKKKQINPSTSSTLVLVHFYSRHLKYRWLVIIT